MLSSNESFFSKKRKDVFGKIYIANVRNRLRELVNPNDADCKRWPWELVQNAKDSISGQPGRKVDIEFIINSDIYIFKHNGCEFNEDTLFGLLYKFSEGKSNNHESTGRFGTGFLTTHSLSKIVEISGDIIGENETEPKGFSVTMYREGEDKELLEGLNKTEKSFQYFEEPLGWTTYKYKAITKRNKEAGQLGIQNFKDNIDKVMLFCPEINSIKLNDNGRILTIERGSISKLKYECQKITFMINDNKKCYNKTFLFNKVEEYNEKLSKRFGTNRNVRICCALELDENNDIFINKASPSLFCSLPLVGSEVHELPFIINSPDFEPDSERQAIFLDGIEIDEKTGKISDPGINKMILERSQKMYENLLKYICDNNIGKRYKLARGLRSIPNVKRFFDREWYKNYFLNPMRNVLLSYPIFKNGSQYYKISQIYIPNLLKELDKNQVYDFISQIFNNKVPSYYESIEWEKYLWTDDEKIKFVDIEECVKCIDEYNNVIELQYNINDDVWEWLNSFLSFIKYYHPNYLQEYAIIPNMDLEFVKLSNDLATSKYVPENIIECLENLDINWKGTHIHKNIKKYSPGSDHNIDFAVSEIRKTLKEWSDNVLKLMHYIPKDCGDKKFIEKRKMIYEICSKMWTNKFSGMEDGSGFPKDLWNGIDEMVFDKLLLAIQNIGGIKGIISIDYINRVLDCVTEYYPYYTDYSIIPNQNKKLCKLNDVYKDSDIPELFKDCLKNCFNEDIKNKLIDKKIKIKLIRNVQEKNIYSYVNTLRSYFNMPEEPKYSIYGGRTYSEYIPLYSKKEAAKYLIKIVPKDLDSEQRKLFDLYQNFTNYTFEKHEYCEIDHDEGKFGIWDNSNKYIFKIIRDIIEKHSNVDSLANYLNKNKNEILQDLRIFIKRFSEKGKIVPNQYGVFCKIKNLMNDGDNENSDIFIFSSNNKEIKLIPEELKDIAKKLGYDIRAQLVHERMERPCSRSMSYEDVCKKIDEIMEEKYNDKSTYNDEDFKDGAYQLIEKYFKTISEIEKEKLFSYTYEKKSNITVDVIIDEQARETLVNIRNEYNDDEVKQLITNSNKIKKIIKDMEFSNYESSQSSVIGSGSKSIKITYGSGMDHSKYDSLFESFIRYGDFYFENKNEETGIIGEAYIYELLRDSGKFKNVIWKMEDNYNGRRFRYNGTTYYIRPDGSHYDIEVETFNNCRFYIEVKSTKYELGNKVPFFISKKQIDMMKLTEYPNKYILAIVFNAMSNPSHFFMTMDEDIDN